MNLALYNIQIIPQGLGAAAGRYRRQVIEHLTWIDRTKMGRLLLTALRFHGKPITIQPYTGGDCNASGGTRDVGGAIQGVVFYSPDTFSLHGACSATTTVPNRGLFWDEVLFHELVHVFRQVSGKWNKQPLTFGLNRYDDTEEFIAVLVANIYISDKTNKIKTGLRADHKTLNPLSADLEGPFGFYRSGRQTFSLIEAFCNDNHGISVRIANDLADAPFNPIADYFLDKEKARTISQNAPVDRDIKGVIEDMSKFVQGLF